MTLNHNISPQNSTLIFFTNIWLGCGPWQSKLHTFDPLLHDANTTVLVSSAIIQHKTRFVQRRAHMEEIFSFDMFQGRNFSTKGANYVVKISE